MQSKLYKLSHIKPHKRQLEWQKLEFYAFIHFGMNTFMGNQWGRGDESPDDFNPSDLDAENWVLACKAAHMKGLILTAKHHDGFCLWPSKYTEHSVKNSPWKNGKGDVVKDLADACAKHNMKLGIYLSPWDRHDERYGDSLKYDEYFRNQLRELLTNYGEVFCVWFDGACGEGPNGKRQIYDWESYYNVIRECQINACISVCGEDVRWCGNEAGHCRPSEWSVLPKELKDCEKIAKKSQKVDDIEFIKKFSVREDDLGSRDSVMDLDDFIWYPAEVNTSIRPNWFYDSNDDDKVRSLDELMDIYYKSVGGNGTFLLNIPPDKRGLFHENDVLRLKEIGQELERRFSKNILDKDVLITASEIMSKKHDVYNILDDNEETYYCPNENTTNVKLSFVFKNETSIETIVLKEHIKNGQRIEKFSIECLKDDKLEVIYEGSIIGYKKICILDKKVNTKEIRISILESRWCPEIETIEMF